MNYKLSSKAEEDVAEIYTYGIHNFGISVASSYLEGLHKIANRLIFYKELWRPTFF